MSKVQTPECHETGAAGWDRFLARRPALGVRSPTPRGIRGAVVRGSSLVWVQRVLPAPWSSHTVLPLNPRCPRKPAPRSRDSHRDLRWALKRAHSGAAPSLPRNFSERGKAPPPGMRGGVRMRRRDAGAKAGPGVALRAWELLRGAPGRPCKVPARRTGPLLDPGAQATPRPPHADIRFASHQHAGHSCGPCPGR